MIECLTTITTDFAGDANRVRCLAHIVNLVVKIILRQFDVPKKKEKKDQPVPNDNNNVPDLASGNNQDNNPEVTEEKLEELARVLDKEEKEMDEGDDDEESEKLLRDVEIIEKAMEKEIKKTSKMVKPVRQVLFKVSALFYYWPGSLGPQCLRASFFFFWLLFFFASFLPPACFSLSLFLPWLFDANNSTSLIRISASKTRICNQELDNSHFTSMVRNN